MRERPILFSASMVRAIFANEKTMTRRIVKYSEKDMETFINKVPRKAVCCPYGLPGDRLWVRETFQPILADGVSRADANYKTGEGYAISYPATDGRIEFLDSDDEMSDRCKPAIHMPRWASRILLEITETRVERLQSITEEDAIAEGIELAHPGTTSTWWKDYEAKPTPDALQDPYHGLAADPVESFASLWRSINGRDSWDANPWVWVVSFRRIEAQR